MCVKERLCLFNPCPNQMTRKNPLQTISGGINQKLPKNAETLLFLFIKKFNGRHILDLMVLCALC